MACRGIKDNYAIIDCTACNGQGYITVLHDHLPPNRETCKVCEGTCVVRVPIIKIPVLNELPINP